MKNSNSHIIKHSGLFIYYQKTPIGILYIILIRVNEKSKFRLFIRFRL